MKRNDMETVKLCLKEDTEIHNMKHQGTENDNKKEKQEEKQRALAPNNNGRYKTIRKTYIIELSYNIDEEKDEELDKYGIVTEDIEEALEEHFLSKQYLSSHGDVSGFSVHYVCEHDDES